jgi:nicotinamide phosphoribosyltransferase
MKNNPLFAIDFYKADHRRQYPEGTQFVFSNFTARSSHLFKGLKSFDNKIVFFGLQYFLKDYLINSFNEFFKSPKWEVVTQYKRLMDYTLGKDSISTEHIEALHDLQYLPISISALPEGTRVPIKIPVLTIYNTLPEFFWLVNYLETVLSAYLWKPITNATIAYEYKKLLTKYADKTGASKEFIQFQAHDFSFRGMSGVQDATISGLAHLTSFVGTDTIPAILCAEDYYHANIEEELVGCSVPATEHSVMCMGSQVGELETFKRLINEVYPKGIVSIVSDTWDFWKVITEYLVILKTDILNRDGKVVIRPDSGDPVKIICGDIDAKYGSPEFKGAIECLYEIFGGTINEKGYKELDPHIGLIYGDSITLERASQILNQLEKAGFASSNIVFGVGSFTYQYNTRDTFGFAVKATAGMVNGDYVEIFKSPKTDSGTKKSAKGFLKVTMNNQGELELIDQLSSRDWMIDEVDQLKIVFHDSVLFNEISLNEIRSRLK